MPAHVGHQFLQSGRGRVGETCADEVVEQRLTAAPVATEVEQQDRLGVVAELAQGHHVQDLVERAKPARQDDERVGLRDQQLLARRTWSR